MEREYIIWQDREMCAACEPDEVLQNLYINDIHTDTKVNVVVR